MRSRGWTMRMAALMGAGTFAVHQLRFALTYDHATGSPQPVGGHGYLAAMGPVVAGLLVLALTAAMARVARGTVEPAPRFRRLWAGASASLFAVYCAQEAIEGLLSAGHPDGVAGVLGHGGWVAAPLALSVGLAIALLMRGAAAATVLAVRRAPRPAPSFAPPLQVLLPPWAPARTRASSRHLAARGPPVAA